MAGAFAQGLARGLTKGLLARLLERGLLEGRGSTKGFGNLVLDDIENLIQFLTDLKAGGINFLEGQGLSLAILHDILVEHLKVAKLSRDWQTFGLIIEALLRGHHVVLCSEFLGRIFNLGILGRGNSKRGRD